MNKDDSVCKGMQILLIWHNQQTTLRANEVKGAARESAEVDCLVLYKVTVWVVLAKKITET